MIASAPGDFTEMVNMGTWLEEGVREGRLSRDEASTSKRYGSNFGKKKDNETNAISSGRQRRPQIKRNPPSRQHHHHQVSFVIPIFYNQQTTPVNNTNVNNNNRNNERTPKTTTIPTTTISNKTLRGRRSLLTRFPCLTQSFIRAPEHDIENCYLLKYEVQKLMKNGMMSFEDRVPNVNANPLRAHGNSSMNMVDGFPGEFKVFDVHFIRRSLVQMHKHVCLASECEHDHDGCVVCSVKPRGCDVVKRTSSD
ncbi:hypothetical protein KIW84_043966 [Lathyrus oleraceus]|uniref:Uncharacterized protein n=1 Tax=Pisum sativum TaxID=3888 RepID=A0A9D5AV90_PEA|nr:hypothetical protein KIW84_043966 [Pisum sativum]